jgi:hypothetical protein
MLKQKNRLTMPENFMQAKANISHINGEVIVVNEGNVIY